MNDIMATEWQLFEGDCDDVVGGSADAIQKQVHKLTQDIQSKIADCAALSWFVDPLARARRFGAICEDHENEGSRCEIYPRGGNGEHAEAVGVSTQGQGRDLSGRSFAG